MPWRDVSTVLSEHHCGRVTAIGDGYRSSATTPAMVPTPVPTPVPTRVPAVAADTRIKMPVAQPRVVPPVAPLRVVLLPWCASQRGSWLLSQRGSRAWCPCSRTSLASAFTAWWTDVVAAEATGMSPASVPMAMAGPTSEAFMVIERGFMDPRIVVVNGRRLSFRVRRNDKLKESSITGGEMSP